MILWLIAISIIGNLQDKAVSAKE